MVVIEKFDAAGIHDIRRHFRKIGNRGCLESSSSFHADDAYTFGEGSYILYRRAPPKSIYSLKDLSLQVSDGKHHSIIAVNNYGFGPDTLNFALTTGCW